MHFNEFAKKLLTTEMGDHPKFTNSSFQTTFVVKFIFWEFMGLPVRIDSDLYHQAKSHAHAERRTISGQIEFWAMIGKAALVYAILCFLGHIRTFT